MNSSCFYIKRRNQALIEKSIASSFVTAVLGPRRVGKSTLLKHLSSKLPSANKLYLSMDDRKERNLIETNGLKAIIEERLLRKIAPNNIAWVIVDEAQKCPAIFEQIKILYDQFKDQSAIKFILTGSGSFSLHQLSAETLAGRIQLYKLREFNLRETFALQSNKTISDDYSVLASLIDGENLENIAKVIDDLSPFRSALTSALRTQLLFGGLPEVLQATTEDERWRYLANYLQTYLEKDILAVQSISDLNIYQKLMGVIAEQTGSVRSDQKIINALQVSRETIKKYRGLLAATLMYEEIYPFIDSSLKRLVKAPKGYLTNNGLISYLTGIHDYSLLEKTGLIGHRFENWFLKELRTYLDQHPYLNEINYWRTSNDSEVDLIVNLKQRVIPCEITYSTQVDRKKIRTLKMFLQKEKKAPYGIIIYNGDFSYDATTRIYHIPAWMV